MKVLRARDSTRYAALLVTAAITVSVSGCLGQPRDAGLLWAWPSRAEARAVTGTSPGWGRTAFFRFREAPPEGSLTAEVRPAVPFNLGYAGQMVFVVLEIDRLDNAPYEVTLKDRQGNVLGKAYVGWPEPEEDEPLVSVVERRTWSSQDGRSGLEEYVLARSAGDGATVRAGYGNISVEIRVPLSVAEETLRDAVKFDPARGAEIRVGEVASPLTGLLTWRVLTIEWPGVESSGTGIVDPAGIAAAPGAPPGFALKMEVSVDAEKVPAFRDFSGTDHLFRVSVSRSEVTGYSMKSLETGAVLVPPEGFRTVHSVKIGPHRFYLSFSKAVDQNSVERALVSSVIPGGMPASLSFTWKGTRELECEITPPRAAEQGGVTYKLSVKHALDADGLPVSFPGEAVIRFAPEFALAQVSPEDPAGPASATLSLPPGVTAAMSSPGGEFVLGLEQAEPQVVEGPALYHLWLYSVPEGKWTDLGNEIRPVSNAQWVDDEQVVAWDRNGWDVIYVRSGETKRVEWARSGRSLLGLCPLPDGRTVAIIQGTMNAQSYEPADLIVCDLEGTIVLGRWSRITGTDVADFYRESLPVLYAGAGTGGERTGSLPWRTAQESSGTVYLVDRPRTGPTRVLEVSVGSGEVSVVPGTEYASRSPGDALAVLGADGSYLAFVRSPGSGEEGVEGTTGEICFVDLKEGKCFGSVAWRWAGESPVKRLVPSPDGRYLLAGSILIDVDKLRSTRGDGGKTWPDTGGLPAGWSADGKRLYIVRAR